MASNQGGVTLAADNRRQNVGALDLKMVLDELQVDSAYKDPQSLCRPLSISDSSGSREGARFHVTYQGLPGAYNEAVATKAYPNCEAV